MSNFIGLVFATLKNEGVDTKGMSTDEAIKKYREITGGKDGTPAEQRKIEEKTKNNGTTSWEDIEEQDITSINGKDYYIIEKGENYVKVKEYPDGYKTEKIFKDQIEKNEGTPAEQKRIEEPKSKHIDHDKFDETEKWFVERHKDDKLGIKGFKEAREQINEMANSGMTYDEIDDALFEKTTTLDYVYEKLADKKDKTEEEKQRLEYLYDYGVGYKTAIGQLYRMWKK